MASVFHLYQDALHFKISIIKKYEEYEETEKKFYCSALIIQKNWRAYAVRKNIQNWNKAARSIQRFVRGWLVRKNILSVKDMREKRASIRLATEKMQETLKTAFDNLRLQKLQQSDISVRKVLEILFDRHHLLRTKIRAGVFSSQKSNNLSNIETILKQFPLKNYMKQLNKIKRNRMYEM